MIRESLRFLMRLFPRMTTAVRLTDDYSEAAHIRQLPRPTAPDRTDEALLQQMRQELQEARQKLDLVNRST